MALPDRPSAAIVGDDKDVVTSPREIPAQVAQPRRDIQALRAVAVALVVVYHSWPQRLTGGYVGVDVFLVISGFLITLHLLERPIRSAKDLFSFWSRRIRRLIPAATLVLVTTLAASIVWLPQTVHERVAKEVLASAFYVENWLLALTSTDYLATDQLQSPTQHYWSLSVEEQFYIVWPVLIALALLVCRRRGLSLRFPPLLVIGVVSLASLAFSAWFTREDAGQAYFVTTTRVWELGVGAAVAAAVHAGLRARGAVVRSVLVWGGLAAILWSAMAFTVETSFPGVAALVPTLGAAAVIAARSDDLRTGPRRLWSGRHVQWLGDVSYSVYLWHWPAIVIAPFVLDEDDMRAWQKCVLIAGVLCLSGLSKRWVEEPFRFAPKLTQSVRRSFVLLGACLALSAGLAGLALWHGQRVIDSAATVVVDPSARCVGADFFRTAACATRDMPLLTTPVAAAKDKPEVYSDGCWNERPFTRRKVCGYGPRSTPVRIALYGNSHAGAWFPPLHTLARERGWRIDTYLTSECYSVDVPISFNPPEIGANCQAWNDWTRQRINSGGYDLVVMSDRTLQPLVGVPANRKTAVAQQAYRRVLEGFVRQGLRVLVIRDTPDAGGNVPDCVARYADDLTRCGIDVDKGLEPDPLTSAALQGGFPAGAVSTLDATNLLCQTGRCPAVVGGLITYFDHGHMTTQYSMTLYPEVASAVTKALRP